MILIIIVPFAKCIIDQVQISDFEILYIFHITENCRINEAMVENMSNSNYFQNPFKTDKTIFPSCDFIHVMKICGTTDSV